MKKIVNPYLDVQDYNCFGCCPSNALGLKMDFYEDGEFICCQWSPELQFQGYNNVLHGGIQVTLMDEIASWFVQVKLATAGVTSSMECRFLKPVLYDKSPILLKARLQNKKRNLAEIMVQLYTTDDLLCAESKIVYYTFNAEVAREKLNYPGVDAFFK